MVDAVYYTETQLIAEVMFISLDVDTCGSVMCSCKVQAEDEVLVDRGSVFKVLFCRFTLVSI